MTIGIDKVAVLRIGPNALHRFAPADESAPEHWKAFVGDGGGPFAVRPLEDAVLVMPFASFDTTEALSLHLRLLLGPTLDEHADLRGILVISHEHAAEGHTYDDFANAPGGTWIVKALAEDSRLPSEAGWSFADAARAFATPGARTRVNAAPADSAEAQSTEQADPFEKAEGKFGEIFAARNERGALRRTLSAALDHSLDASALGALIGSAGESESEENASPLAGVIRRGVASDPNTMNALESELRKVIDGGLKNDSPESDSKAREDQA